MEKRSLTSAQLAMHRAFVALYRDQALSVKALCCQAHVARSTFYAYYDNLEQLLEEIEDNLLYQLLETNQDFGSTVINSETGFPFFQNTCRLIDENREVFSAFLVETPNVRFLRKWQTGIKFHFYRQLSSGPSVKNAAMLLELVSTMALSAFAYWLQNPQAVDLDSMDAMIVKAFSLLS